MKFSYVESMYMYNVLKNKFINPHLEIGQYIYPIENVKRLRFSSYIGIYVGG